jgi:hypothetical protein
MIRTVRDDTCGDFFNHVSFRIINPILDQIEEQSGSAIRSLVWEQVRFPMVQQTVFQGRDQIAIHLRNLGAE